MATSQPINARVAKRQAWGKAAITIKARRPERKSFGRARTTRTNLGARRVVVGFSTFTFDLDVAALRPPVGDEMSSRPQHSHIVCEYREGGFRIYDERAQPVARP